MIYEELRPYCGNEEAPPLLRVKMKPCYLIEIHKSLSGFLQCWVKCPGYGGGEELVAAMHVHLLLKMRRWR